MLHFWIFGIFKPPHKSQRGLQGNFLLCMLIFPLFMLPVMWFLWLYPTSGNANFIYFQTIVFQVLTAQKEILLYRSVLWRYRRVGDIVL